MALLFLGDGIRIFDLPGGGRPFDWDLAEVYTDSPRSFDHVYRPTGQVRQ